MAQEFKDNSAIVIDEFNGLWSRGGSDSVPLDHFSDCNNVKFIQSGFEWRDGIEPFIPREAVRIYPFTKQTGTSLLILDSSGNFYDSDYPNFVFLTVATATDFGFQAFAGRAYVTPCDGNTGIQNEFVYVYEGDGTAARKAAGFAPTNADGALAAVNSATAGNVEAGIHVFAVVYETDTGFLTAIGPDTLPSVTADGTHKVDLSNIPISPNAYVVKRHVVATKLIQPQFYTGDTRGYQFFFLPDGVIPDNTATTLTVNFFDSELLEDASYLLDMLEEIPAGAGLSIYHNRMVQFAEFDNISQIRVSVAGEPEAFNSVDGIVIFPLDGNPVTNVQEYRDIMYGFKLTKTNAWSDNGDEPSTWAMTVLDQGIGSGLHSIAKVLDSNGVNVNWLMIGSFGGIYLFNGAYQDPELTWKIRDFWLALDRDSWDKIQIINSSIEQTLEMTLSDGTMLHCDYSNGLDAKNVRFSPWTFDPFITSIAYLSDQLILAANGLRT